ncbi:1-pyrroline-5-carboxylate dehydrogenase [Pseudoclavibacter endophyticus]|uniref:L-glutamate gamma-semialdehyde dehydrogenase n=1 Tax=Pseudoclavibacter endophyticus TaxID=1778590 RepID=A0A6H9WRF8_9MICO|nr:proline dehydrogenase family protein [Pseudoclavibacter endophyticus]KAB1649355.1 aldehyde dehydrogenase family protein [Pseudoclavibacter endophyticus]GGA63242.1 1-pyrroline-5-carboxylate dehydrogenase [Pseudoclavibacter endophyticus]
MRHDERANAAPVDAAELHALIPDVAEQVRDWLRRAEDEQPEAAAQRLGELLREPGGLDFAVRFVDGVIRPDDQAVAARNLHALVKGTPQFLPRVVRGLAGVGGRVSSAAPGVVVPAARRVLRALVGHLVVEATPRRLGRAIGGLTRDGARLNLHLLGEDVLGDRWAQRRRDGTIELLRRDDVDCVSIKVSAVIAPHQPWGFEDAVERIVDRLLPLYRVAAASSPAKLVNLDMESYRDLELTIAVFTRLLDRPEFAQLTAGIALQAYVPDAAGAMARLQAWAAARVERGGAPVRVRLVKGANLPMERVDAEVHGWPLATFGTKAETDASFRRILAWSLTPDRTRNVRIGVASHNLFDVALAWHLARRRGVDDAVEFEMLLGMAQRQAEVVRRDVGGLLLYTPVVAPDEFDAAIAYLVRRLDEASGADNVLSVADDLGRDESLFERELRRFEASIDSLADAPAGAGRMQDRAQGADPLPASTFVPAPDSDPSLVANQAWAATIRERARELGELDSDGEAPRRVAPGAETVAANTVTTREELEERIRTARDAGGEWRELDWGDRADVLRRAGDAIERRRAELIEIMIAEAGKTFDQADPEVSEAADFARRYAELASDLGTVDGAIARPARLIAVTPPWNFPVAIPAGSTLASLAAGSAVIVKPARATARCAAVVVEALWEAGVPRAALQFVRFADRSLQQRLIASPAVERVVLTGGYDTAEAMLRVRPDLPLLAETSGKNAIIVTPSADLDLAVRDIVASAFGHAGQKCSAASLVVLVGSMARSRRLRDQLRDAVSSLRVGPVTDASSQIGPVIAPAEGKLLRALTELDGDERWFVQPRRLDEAGRLWRPGIRVGVRRGSAMHRTEYFGPVLGIMTAETLDAAIELVNEVEYGLTSGLHSLDPDEITQWCDRVQAGNLYVNRGITGAIVQRQPFGGWKRSAVGPTTKVGGPNTLVPLVDWTRAVAREAVAPPGDAPAGGGPAGGGPSGDPGAFAGELPAVRGLRSAARALAATADDDACPGSAAVTPGEADFLARALASDQRAWEHEFGVARDVQALAAERNVFRYVPVVAPVLIRLAPGGRVADLLRVVAAGVRAGGRMRVSVAAHIPRAARAAIAASGVSVQVDLAEAFEANASHLPGGSIRLVGGDAGALARAIGPRGDIAVYGQPVTEAGRIELLPFLREQSISITAHRFGTRNADAWSVLPGDAPQK